MVGIESGNSYIRNIVMNRKISKEEIIFSFKLLHQYGIKTVSQNMIGLPEETPEKFLEMIALNAEILPNDASLSAYYPYPGTQLFDHCIKKKLLIEKDFKKNPIIERKDTKLDLPEFPKKRILFYVENYTYLIKYKSLSNKWKIVHFLFPLSTRNQRIIPFLMKCLNKLRRLLSLKD